MFVARLAAVAALALAPATLAPPDAYSTALAAYRAGDAEACSRMLEHELQHGAGTAGHWTLLGWCRLRAGDLQGAVAAFLQATTLEPRLAEGLSGLALARERVGDPAGALDAARRAAALGPPDADTSALLRRLGTGVQVERRPRPPVDRATPYAPVRAAAARFEVLRGTGWEPFFVRGINLGTALPGTFPGEFPDDPALYREWFDQMSDLGVNTVRLYTLHPPSLYRALAEHNAARPERKLWLVQGVWTELPPADDFDLSPFVDEFRAEIGRVIDAVHGNLELPPRPGRAHGIYDADVSGAVLAWLLGREWEPYAVAAYNALRPERHSFAGRFVRVEAGQPIEVWLASMLDAAAQHETEGYGLQHPVAFVSWPTLDPLVHPTEATVAEELVLRGRAGDPPEDPLREYDNDAVSIDPTVMRATAAFAAGTYAAYHAYPYYPDFMLLEPAYARATDEQGTSRYLGYLRDLARHHGAMPVLIAEVGVPTSRGIAHLHPEGQHHGGHDARAQGEIDARLLRNIDAAGLAGGVLFAWIDEWFKRNWLVLDHESPPERNALWLNALDAEQNYGLIAALPGARGPRVVLDGHDDDWRDAPTLYRVAEARGGVLRALRATHDEGWLYLQLELRAGPASIDWTERQYWIGIDTYDAARGDHRFPEPAGVRTPLGLEFLIRLEGESRSRLLVDPPYDAFANRRRRPYRSVPNDDGVFRELDVICNRSRYGRDGTLYPARAVSQSPLRFGSTDPAAPRYTALADWYAGPDGRAIELRLPWGLLNVTDPSSHQVAHETRAIDGVVETATTEGFRFHVLALRRTARGFRVDGTLPERDEPTLDDFPSFRWPGWERPTYRLEPKESYYILQRELPAIPRRGPTGAIRGKDRP